MGRVLEYGVRYDYVVDNLAFGPLSRNALNKLFSDGRVCSRMIEPLVALLFDDLDFKGNDNGLVRLSTNKKQEVRTFTKSGCNLVPSSQLGIGREYNKDEYLARVASVESYIIVDIRSFPALSIISWPSFYIMSKYSDGRKVSDSILKGNKSIKLTSHL